MDYQDELQSFRESIIKAFDGYDKTLTGKKAAKDCQSRMVKALTEQCKAHGQDPAWEVHAFMPHDGRSQTASGAYCASWEAGPFDWGPAFSWLVMNLTGRLAEPYYGFDLCFYESE